MEEPKSAALRHVIAAFDALSADDQFVFLNDILVKPSKKALEGHPPATLLRISSGLLGLESLAIAARKLQKADAVLSKLTQRKNAAFMSMSKTVDEAIAHASWLADEISHRTVKPRNADRDKEIVRLHDEEGKSFGEIARLLCKKNASWCRKDGKQLSRDTVERAYHRQKKG